MRTRPRINRSHPKKEKQSIEVKFYPEGGHLIEKVNNRIAFEIRDKEGKVTFPKYIFIETNTNIILDTLHVIHNGWGTFDIKQRYWEVGLKIVI